ncbi:copper resistance protein D [Halalkalicoccus paucihalophilus]|uniref:Copper resistance protein D n=1 Tax=Halalkalicoccus paucihalophilus TaxID=1008153 RepID=A0A151AEW3_9EURY|nr:CopD family protein [Halalkalicoccus paucihalophilus]KYH25927.1 copper resistance protein D [Halalkalicoccus paucihalophilus]
MEPWNPLFRGVLVTALILLVGVPPTLSFVVFPELERRGLDTTRARHVSLSIITATLIGAGLAASALAVGNARASEVGTFLTWMGSTAAGGAWTVFIAAAIVSGAVTAGHRAFSERVSRRFWLGTVSVGALVMLVAFCWTRFSTAIENPAVAILVKFAHMGGGALWVGGLAVLAVLPSLVPREPETDLAEFVLSTVRRFSLIAVAGVTIAVTTGVVISAWHVPALSALVTTKYGILLSLKVGLVTVAAAIGGFNRVVLHDEIAYSVGESKGVAALPGMLTGVRPRIAASDAVSTVTRSIRIELTILMLAVGLSVALTTAVTPSYELLEPAVAASSEVVQGVPLTEFGTLLELGAISVALAGALTLGYEVGQFGVHRKERKEQPDSQPREEVELSND